MEWLRKNAAVLGLVGALLVAAWGVFVAYGPLAKKNEVDALERVLEAGLLELARCVDDPEYLPSEPEQPVTNCETRVFRALQEEDRSR